MVSFDPNRPDFAPYGLTCVQWTPSPMKRPDHHNEIELNLVTRGWVVYLLAGRKIRLTAGHLGVFWASIPHQVVEFAKDTHYFAATIPLAWFLQCRLSERFVQRLLRGEVFSEDLGLRLKREEDRFRQWEEDLKQSTDETRNIVMLEMEGRLRRMVLALPEVTAKPGGASRGKGGPLALHGGEMTRVERMACVIARRYTEPLTVAEIGREVGLHPNYAMGLFKKAFGTTLIDYLTHHRISHAQRLLATTDEKIVEIAFSSGFNSISRFNEAFRRACGCTPREYRHHHPNAE
jgi:AraC family transcriptional regulator, melibiose operon regulatory protein